MAGSQVAWWMAATVLTSETRAVLRRKLVAHYGKSVTIIMRADDYWRVVNMFSITVANSICASGMFVHNGETTTTTYACDKVEKICMHKVSVSATRLFRGEVEVHGISNQL